MKKLLLIAFLLGCQHPEPPVTPAIAEASSYKIFTPDSHMGTAWVVDGRYLITAGHVCDAGPGDYTLESSTGRKLAAHPIAWEQDYSDMVDVCLVLADGELAPPLALADAMPAVGDAVGYVGYPLGELKRSTGKYLGDVDGPDDHLDDYTADAPCDHGASGSAMYSEDGVYGVLVRGIVIGEDVLPGEYGCVASPLPQIIDILGHR